MLSSNSALVFAGLSVFVASVIGGLVGFGLNLVSVPALIMVLPVKAVISAMALVAVAQKATMLVGLRRWLSLRRIWPLFLAAVVGVLVGARLLLVLDAQMLKLIIGAVSAVVALALLMGFQRPLGESSTALGGVGLVSGVLGGTTGLSGPPVVLFLTNQGTQKQAFRANLTAYFLVLGLVRLVAYASGGLLTAEVVRLALLVMPLSLAGTWVGIRLAPRANEEVFRKITLSTLIATSLLVVASGLGWI